jgi:hypothetical protein
MKMNNYTRLAVALLFAPLLGACEGDNLFDGTTSGSGNGPMITNVSLLRTSVPQCGSIDVSVSAQSQRALATLTVLLRYDGVGGADQTQEVDLGSNSFVVSGRVVSMDASSAGTARVLAFVEDEFGNVSALAEAPSTVTVTPLAGGGGC